jgi:hypothetical protein
MENQYRQESRPRSRSFPYPAASGPKQVRYKFAEDHREKKEEHKLSEAASPITILKNLILLCVTIIIATGATTKLIMLYITVRPFSLSTYRRLSCKVVAQFFDGMALIMPNMKIFLTGDSDALSPIGVSFIVCNHLMDGDWWAMLMLARCVGLRGSIKAFLQYRGNDHNSSATSSSSTSSSASINATGLSNSASSPALAKYFQSNSASSNLSTQGFTHMTRNLSQPTGLHRIGKLGRNHTNNGIDQVGRHHHHQSLAITFLNKLLDFPLLSSENTQNYVQERNQLFSLLKSFASPHHDHAQPHSHTSYQLPPIHLLLFPEGWPDHQDRKSMIAKSREYAKREGRPPLKHLLLPRTTGFYASLDSLRDSSPVVYDITMAYKGYDGGQTPFSSNISFETLMKVINGKIPSEVFVHIKRFSMGEVLSDNNWLDKRWMEKDRLLEHFARHGSFPVDNRGFSKHVMMDTKGLCVESSLTSLVKLSMVFFCIPVIVFLMFPILCGIGWIWLAFKSFEMLFPGGFGRVFASWNDGAMSRDDGKGGGGGEGSVNSGSDSAVGTPFFPVTPFASPLNGASWTSGPAASASDLNKNQKRR